jgi:cytidine deaminase
MSGPIDWEALRAAAAAARAHAYAPYSGFAVGAALLADDGRVFTGVNVENASYGLTVCAERNAIGAAVVEGARRFRAIVVVADGPSPVTPCGMCRQVLREFPPSFPVRCYTGAGRPYETDVDGLLPAAFGPEHLQKKPSP